MDRVLLVEDGRHLSTSVREILATQYEVVAARNIQEAQDEIRKNSYALILTQSNLEDGRGYHLCPVAKQSPLNHATPIIVITDHKSLEEKVLALSLGAADFLYQPIDADELLARIKGRIQYRNTAEPEMKFQNMVVRLQQQKAFLLEGGEANDLKLTTVEFKILCCLLNQLNKIWTREQLLEAVWGKTSIDGDRSIDVHVSNLRKKLGPIAGHLRSIYGVGYSLSEQKRAPRKNKKPESPIL